MPLSPSGLSERLAQRLDYQAWPLRPFFMAMRRLSSYADATMRSVLIRLCLVAVYVLVLLEVGMVLGAVT